MSIFIKTKEPKVSGYNPKTVTLNSIERHNRVNNSLIFCTQTGCYISGNEYKEHVNSLNFY